MDWKWMAKEQPGPGGVVARKESQRGIWIFDWRVNEESVDAIGVVILNEISAFYAMALCYY